MKTLLAIVTLMQRANGKQLFFVLCTRLIVILGLVMVTALIIAATLVGGLIHAHLALLQHGMSAPAALLIIAASALCMITMLVILIIWRLRCLRKVSSLHYGHSSFFTRALDIFEAFTDGLQAKG